MSRAKTNKVYNTFVKGLITEASPLTYPANSSIDEDNCTISRRGNRSRRFGIDFEENHHVSSFHITNVANTAIQEYKWESIGGDPSFNSLVVQVGLNLYFYGLSEGTISTNQSFLTVDLTPFIVTGATNAALCPVQMVSGNGYLFVVGEKFEPFYVEYHPDGSISTSVIYIQTRDFRGVDDGLANDEEPGTLSAEHEYNLRNQGWVNPTNDGGSGTSVTYFDDFGGASTYVAPDSSPITAYFISKARYPGNNKQWWSGKDATTGDFDPDLLSKFYIGNNRAPRGHYILNAFYKDRSAISGVAGLTIETIKDRPKTVAFFAGRVWYGCNSNIYYSQVLDDVRKAGFCYQEADPTSEDISDLIATDGGVIPIPEMAKAQRLIPMGSGILIFSTNGIWHISGASSGFTAVDISVAKVHTIGTDSPNSIIEANTEIYWWSRIGIMGMTQSSGMFGPIEGKFEKVNISETTIQDYYNNDISENAKQFVKGVYDPATNTIQWLVQTEDNANPYTYSRVLNFDLTLQAFYPWTISSNGTTSPYICGVFTTPAINPVETTSNITSAGNPVTVASSDVAVSEFTTSVRNTFIKYLVMFPGWPVSQYPGQYYFSIAQFKNTNFVDWAEFDDYFNGGEGFPYLSFVETGYELLEDTMRHKQTPYVFCYFRQTEEHYINNGLSGFTPDHQSSCYFQVKWDWASTSASNKFSTKVQVYRIRKAPPVDIDDLSYNTGFPIVVTKNKVRGNGRAIQFRFESDERGKDFDLLGWAVSYSGNSEP